MPPLSLGLVGGVVDAVVGASVGGLVGAVVGALVGGLAGAVVGASVESKILNLEPYKSMNSVHDMVPEGHMYVPGHAPWFFRRSLQCVCVCVCLWTDQTECAEYDRQQEMQTE